MLIQIALTLTVLLGFCGLVLDVGTMQLKKLQLQNAADAAALGASYFAGDPSAALAAARADAALNGFDDSARNGVTVAQPIRPTTGMYANNSSALQVTIQQVVNPVFFPGTKTITAQATALAGSPSACAYLFSTHSSQPSLYSANAPISSGTDKCSVYLGLPYSITDASSTGPQYLVNGAVAGTATNGTVSPGAILNVGAMPDPLASISPPPIRSCDYTANLAITNTTKLKGDTRFCGGFTITNDSASFPSGIYTVQGNITISNSQSVTGTHVLFYMQPLPDGSCGNISIQNSTLTLSAQVTGSLQGILIYSDRSCPVSSAGNGELQLINVNMYGGSFDGIFYLPSQEVYCANTTLKGLEYFGVDADWLSLANGSVNFGSNYTSLQDKSPFPQSGAILVE